MTEDVPQRKKSTARLLILWVITFSLACAIGMDCFFTAGELWEDACFEGATIAIDMWLIHYGTILLVAHIVLFLSIKADFLPALIFRHGVTILLFVFQALWVSVTIAMLTGDLEDCEKRHSGLRANLMVIVVFTIFIEWPLNGYATLKHQCDYLKLRNA